MTNSLPLIRRFVVLGVVAALAAVVQPAAAAMFTVSYTDGGSWNTVYVQGFSPAVEPSPDLGLSAGSTVNLEEFSFFKSGDADGNSDIQLAILNTIWYDWNTPLTTSSAALVGLSDNTIASTASIATGDPITFEFSSLPLTYGSDYAAVAVNVAGEAVTPVLISALTADYVQDPPDSGPWIPETNYGGDSVWQYATSNWIKPDGYFETFTYAGDADFVASFSVIPEPASVLLGLCGAVLVVVGCRSRITE